MKINNTNKMYKKNLLLWLPVFVSYILLSVPVDGQIVSHEGFSWCIEDSAFQHAINRGHIEQIYDAGDVYDHPALLQFTKTVYAIWDTCAAELGYTYTKESFYATSLRPKGMRVEVDAQGGLVRLCLYMTRPTETKEEEDRMHRLMVKLQETRFPPFRKKPKRIYVDPDFYIDINPDSAYYCRTYPTPRPDTPRDTTTFW